MSNPSDHAFLFNGKIYREPRTEQALSIEPGSMRDRCSLCGGWISLGHARGSSCRASLDDESTATPWTGTGRAGNGSDM